MNIVADSHNYTMQGTPLVKLIIKLLTQTAVIYTGGKNSKFKTFLTNLEAYIINANYNIDIFNQNTKVSVKGLKERDKRTYEIMTNLFNLSGK